MEAPQLRIVHPCTVVVPVEAELLLPLLAVVVEVVLRATLPLDAGHVHSAQRSCEGVVVVPSS